MNLLAKLEVRLHLIEERQEFARMLSLRVPGADVTSLGVQRGEQAGSMGCFGLFVSFYLCVGFLNPVWFYIRPR